MREVWIGSTRTGNLIEKIEATNDTNMNVTVLGDDRSETLIPLHKINSSYRSNLESYLKTDERFLAAFKEGTTAGPADFAGPIENFTVSNDKSDVTVNSVGMGIWVENLLVLPQGNRSRIDSEDTVWTVTGTPAQVISQVLIAATTEGGNYRFPQSINPPTGGSTEVITHVFKLSELTTVKDLIDELNQSYEGFETVFVPRVISTSGLKIVWDTFVGNPHYNKDLEPLSVNINQRDGVTGFSYGKNGAEKANWWFAKSQATDPANDKWIDLKSVVKSVPAGDEEHLTLFNKEFFDSALTDVELSAQLSSRMSQADVEMKTFTITVFDKDFSYLTKLGRRLRVTASKRLAGLDELLRITGISWNLNDPSSVQLTVQPAALRVYPRVPNRLSDLVKDQVKDALKEAGWKPPAGLKPETPKTPPYSVGDWDKPTNNINKTDNGLEKSPLQKRVEFSNGGVFWNYAGQAYSKQSPDGVTVIPNQKLGCFYGLGWGALTTSFAEDVRYDPYNLDVYKSMTFNSFPTWGPDAVGNYPTPTNENLGLTGASKKIGMISGELIKAQILNSVPAGYSLKWERFATGSFIKGTNEEERFVVYIHQLQLFAGDKTYIKSKGFAFEIKIDQTTGEFSGDWNLISYPFEVANSSQTYYPMTAQVESYGGQKEVVTCVTPAAYWKDKELPVSYPLIMSDTYWKSVRMGKYAIDDTTITHNYSINETFQTAGMGITAFNSEGDEDVKWDTPYQLHQYGGELWTTNMTYGAYYANHSMTNELNRKTAMRLSLKSKTDKNGKPIEWKILAAQYGYITNGGAYSSKTYTVDTNYIVGFNGLVFAGGVVDGNPIPSPYGIYDETITGKVGADTAKIMYGLVPREITATFWIQDSSSGRTADPFEWFPDFYGFKYTTDKPNAGNDSTWYKTDDYIIPLYNGGADGYYVNDSLHATSSGKPLVKDGNFFVLPAASVSDLLPSTGGREGYWVWYK